VSGLDSEVYTSTGVTMKVLASVLTEEQRVRLRAELKGTLRLTSHAHEQSEHHKVERFELEWTLRNGCLIEFHNEAGTRRILLRSCGVCAVIDLDERVIVTVYRNQEGDHHTTLDYSVYQAGPVADEVLR